MSAPTAIRLMIRLMGARESTAARLERERRARNVAARCRACGGTGAANGDQYQNAAAPMSPSAMRSFTFRGQ